MPNWIHLSIRFNNFEKTFAGLQQDSAQEVPTGIYKDILVYLKAVISAVSKKINRYFYLFEPNPHLFLALEVMNMRNIGFIQRKIVLIPRPDFIESITFDLNTEDARNGEAAIDFFFSGTKLAFYRISDSYKPGYYNNDEVKLVHCLNNQLFVTPHNEISFYIKCLQYRGMQIRR